jgi:hypothetical protein
VLLDMDPIGQLDERHKRYHTQTKPVSPCGPGPSAISRMPV